MPHDVHTLSLTLVGFLSFLPSAFAAAGANVVSLSLGFLSGLVSFEAETDEVRGGGERDGGPCGRFDRIVAAA